MAMAYKRDDSAACGCLALAVLAICGMLGWLDWAGVFRPFPSQEQVADQSYDFFHSLSIAFEKNLPLELRTELLTPADKAQRYKGALYDGGDGLETVDVLPLLPGTISQLDSTSEKTIPIRGLVTSSRQAVNYLYYAERGHDLKVEVTGDTGISPTLTIIGPDGTIIAHDIGSGSAGHPLAKATLPGPGTYTLRVSAPTMPQATYRSNYAERTATNFTMEYAASNYVSTGGWVSYINGHADKLFGVVVGGIGIVIVGLLIVFAWVLRAPPEFKLLLSSCLRIFWMVFLNVDPNKYKTQIPPAYTAMIARDLPRGGPPDPTCQLCGSRLEWSRAGATPWLYCTNPQCQASPEQLSHQIPWMPKDK